MSTGGSTAAGAGRPLTARAARAACWGLGVGWGRAQQSIQRGGDCAVLVGWRLLGGGGERRRWLVAVIAPHVQVGLGGCVSGGRALSKSDWCARASVAEHACVALAAGCALLCLRRLPSREQRGCVRPMQLTATPPSAAPPSQHGCASFGSVVAVQCMLCAARCLGAAHACIRQGWLTAVPVYSPVSA